MAALLGFVVYFSILTLLSLILFFVGATFFLHFRDQHPISSRIPVSTVANAITLLFWTTVVSCNVIFEGFPKVFFFSVVN